MKPFVHVNCAMSADGKIAGVDRKQVTISSEEDKARAKGLRRKYDAILVGVGTVIADDPHLTLKDLDYDTNPIRIVIDPHGRTPDDAKVLDERAPTVMVTLEGCDREWDCEETIRAGTDRIDLKRVLDYLAEDIGIESLLVEGGGETIASFFSEGLVDRYSVFVGGLVIGGRTAPTPCDGDGWVADGGIAMKLISCETLGNGALLTFEPSRRSLPDRLQSEPEVVAVSPEDLARCHGVRPSGGILQNFGEESRGIVSEGLGRVLCERQIVLDYYREGLERVYARLAETHPPVVIAGIGDGSFDRVRRQRSSERHRMDGSQYRRHGAH